MRETGFGERVRRRAEDRMARVAEGIGDDVAQLSRVLFDELAESIPELRGDDAIQALLRASVEANIETFFHLVRHGIAIEGVRAPVAAVEYAHRLAQREVSANALLRAYRIGQSRILDWALAEVVATEPDREVALATSESIRIASFAYVDLIAEQVVEAYEEERERWLANRNTVRAAMLASLLDGDDHSPAAAESALGYRLRRRHLGVVLWTTGPEAAPADLRRMEELSAGIGEAVGAAGPPLFVPRDRGLAWCWLPLPHGGAAVADDPAATADLPSLVAGSGAFRVALGRAHADTGGFRATHSEALRAHAVASIGGAEAVTSFADEGVRVCSPLVRDPARARDLVAETLGGLAADEPNAALLRATLLGFLRAGRSYVAAAEALHLHKNTIRYRIDRAAEARGRPLDDDRLELEIALTACRWLGPAILTTPGPRG